MTSTDSARLERIEAKFDDLLRELKGNGQPGRCAVHEQRLGFLENWRSWVTGALAVLGLLYTAAFGVVIAKMK